MFRLMLVTDRNDTAGRNIIGVVRAAVDGGVDCVQVREKDLSDDVLLRLTERVIEAVIGRAAVVVNGRVAVARALSLGLHLAEAEVLPDALGDSPVGSGDPPGQESVKERALHAYEGIRPMGTIQLWGRSVHSLEAAVRAANEGPDYMLLGTIHETTSKPGLEGSGVELVRRIVDAVGPVPVLAIGGIDVSNAGEVVRSGAYGVAVRSALLRATDPARMAEAILRATDQ